MGRQNVCIKCWEAQLTCSAALKGSRQRCTANDLGMHVGNVGAQASTNCDGIGIDAAALCSLRWLPC